MFFLAAIVLFLSVLPIIQPRVSAQDASLTTQLKREARLYTVTNALVACFQGRTGPGLSTETTTDKLSSEVSVFINQDITVGHHVKTSDGRSNCNDAAWVASALDIVGITNHTEFMELFYNKGSGNSWKLKGDVADGKVDVVNAFLQKSANSGNTVIRCDARQGCMIIDLPDATRYVLYLENLMKGCGAKLVSGADAANSIEADHKAVINIVNSQGNITKQTYKLELDLGREISVGQGVTSDGKLICETLVTQLSNDTLAAAFAQRAKQAIDAGQSVGDVASETDENAADAASCEERMKLSSGWIVCSALELLSNGMDALLGYVDDLLNVNVVKLDTDGSLRASWSYFRAIATFMLLAVGLVMVLSQAIGGDR